MIDTIKYNGLKERLNEKENILIDNISTQVADNINESISYSIDTISENLSAAEGKAQSLNESIGTLEQNVQTLSSFDFTEQFTKVKDSQEALDQASKEAKSIFDKSKSVNDKLIEELSEALKEWQLISGNLSAVTENIDAENKTLANTISDIVSSFNSLSSINSKLTDTMNEVEKRQSDIIDSISQQTSSSVENIVNVKLDRSSHQLLTVVESSSEQLKLLIEQLNALSNNVETNLNAIIEKTNAFSESELQSKLLNLDNNDKELLMKVEDIESKCKPTPLSIATAVMAGIIIIINVVSLLIK